MDIKAGVFVLSSFGYDWDDDDIRREKNRARELRKRLNGGRGSVPRGYVITAVPETQNSQ